MNEPSEQSASKPQPTSAFTPALQEARDDLRKYVNSSCFLVMSHNGYWGRGDTVEKAAQQCIGHGGTRSSMATVLLILGDKTAEIDRYGSVIRDAGSHNITVLERVRLGALMMKE